jgi:uncharacterized protein with HEPN domain
MRDDRLRIEDAIQAIATIQRFLSGQHKSDFQADGLLKDAVLYNFSILGEATAMTSETLKVRHPHVDWRGIKDLRNVVIHFYQGVDTELVWDAYERDLPVLLEQLQALQRKEFPS